jgi:hypothetical protein
MLVCLSFFLYSIDRICPGRHLAEQSLFRVISNLCYHFDVKAKDGVVVDTHAYTTGFNVSQDLH